MNAQFLLGFQQQMDALKDEDVKEVPALPESHRVSGYFIAFSYSQLHVFDLSAGRYEEAERERQDQWAAVAGN